MIKSIIFLSPVLQFSKQKQLCSKDQFQCSTLINFRLKKSWLSSTEAVSYSSPHLCKPSFQTSWDSGYSRGGQQLGGDGGIKTWAACGPDVCAFMRLVKGATQEDGKKNVCQEWGAVMGCMTVLNYPDQCMGGWVGVGVSEVLLGGGSHTPM